MIAHLPDLVFLLVGAAVVRQGAVLLREQRANDNAMAAWIPARGVVTAHVPVRCTGRDESGRRKTRTVVHHADVRFDDVTGRPHQGRSVVANSWQRPVPGQPVTLRYDPLDPSRVALDTVSNTVLHTGIAAGFMATGGFVALIGVALLLRGVFT